MREKLEGKPFPDSFPNREKLEGKSRISQSGKTRREIENFPIGKKSMKKSRISRSGNDNILKYITGCFPPCVGQAGGK